jgi:tRNA pseudouridine55 synthase
MRVDAMNAPRSQRVEVDGWVVLDKPVGMTSTRAVAQLKRLFNAKKAGHAGTLDPLASGLLPIAFGEATKTVPFVQDGEKAYRFTIQWGAETDSDDSDGTVTRRTERLPSAAEIAAALPAFIGTIMQVPPAFSAIKINGERAYDMARDGEKVELVPRPVTIRQLHLVEASDSQAVLEARCGKGTYVRALARDLGRMLECFGHVIALRRTRVGPFEEVDAVTLSALEPIAGAVADVRVHLLSVEAGLSEIACIVVDRDAAARLRRGQPLLLRGRDAPCGGIAYAACGGVPVAFGAVEGGELVPSRVFNLPF